MQCQDLTFLVVEDHEFQRSILVHLLKTLGARQVHTAGDGGAALRVLRNADPPINVLISDLAMPGMDGMEMVRHLGESGAAISLIITSSAEHDVLDAVANMVRAYNVALLGVLRKPVTGARLAALLDLMDTEQQPARESSSKFALADITRAWADGEFQPWFEPRVDLQTGAVRGMSAVACWEHQQLGVLAAESFMPSIQARGLNDDFVWMILGNCLARCGQWQEACAGMPVTVNISFDSLTDVHVASRIQEIAQQAGVPPSLLVLSVTESALNTDAAPGLENLARMRMMGFGLMIDHFGSGLMSADQLSMVAFTELKIKPEFVTGADKDKSMRAGLAVSLELAARLNLLTVAGGIRTSQEWKLLHGWGCAVGQGPFISPPLRGDKVEAWVERWRVEHA